MSSDSSSSELSKLSTLFYYKPVERRNAFLAKSLEEYKLLLKAAEQASYHFQNGDYEKFDSLVGENACQIRAFKIAILATKGGIDFQSLDDRITQSQAKLERLLVPKKLAFLMSTNVSFQEVLDSEDMDIWLTEDEMFILQAFILSEAKEPQPTTQFITSITRKDITSPKKLLKFNSCISFSFSRSVLSKLRRSLADASIKFVRESAKNLSDPIPLKMTSEEYTVEHNGTPCIPMFWTYKTLLVTAKHQNIPLVIHAKFLAKHKSGYKVNYEEFMYFRPVGSNNTGNLTYIYSSPDENTLKQPAVVIEGVVCSEVELEEIAKREWRVSFLRQSIMDVILAGAADHRQYPDPNVEVPNPDSDYTYYRNLAKKNGYSLDNPTTFFINHVYPMQPVRYFAS